MDKFALRSMDAGPAQDYYSVLARVMAEVSRDHAHSRLVIYELARVKLRQELCGHFLDGKWSEIAEQVRGLEAAIDRIESDFAQNAPLLQLNSKLALIQATEEKSIHNALALRSDSQEATVVGDDGAHVKSPIFSLSSYEGHTSSLPNVSETNDPFANAFFGKRLRSPFWRNIQLIVAAALGAAAIYAATVSGSDFGWFGSHEVDTPIKISARNEVGKENNVALGKLEAEFTAAVRKEAPDVALPTEYGVYAVANGRLIELDLLPIRAPDQRVAVAASISTPSRIHLPLGQLQFVVFRRDLATNAPDRVSVRVVARVVRALTFGPTGNAKVANVEGSWVVRSSSYQMKVAPVPDNPEMIVLRPDADLVFPAGRYALVLKGVAYDFTVDGPLTDPAHCLERTDALNKPVYTECRNL